MGGAFLVILVSCRNMVSDHVCDIFTGGSWGLPGIDDAFGTGLTQWIDDDSIFFWHNQLICESPECFEVIVGQIAFEDAVFDADPEVLTEHRDFTQSFWLSDVVCD